MLQTARRFAGKSTELATVFSIALLAFVAAPSQAQQPLVEEFVLNDTVQPVSAAQLDRAITRANTEGAAALLIVLNTPGGLVDSMREMAGFILSSRSRRPGFTNVSTLG